MKTDQFDYQLPPELIAQYPATQREDARMMVVDRSRKTIQHRRITDIGDYLDPADILVMNNTRVIPARLFGKKAQTGGRVEILLLEEKEKNSWEALLKCSRRPSPGIELLLCDGEILASVREYYPDGRVLLQLKSEQPLNLVLEKHGIPPLPPYIEREDQTPEQIEFDRKRYQTVYAKSPGAVAAPTAGLHFSESLLHELEDKGVKRAMLTLHVGVGTFRPVASENINDHRMQEERYIIAEDCVRKVRRSRAEGGRIVAVGSTSVRTLETVARNVGEGDDLFLAASSGRTDIFIRPPFKFRATDAILTNFHLPKSTLLMMMSAFAGREFMLEAYEEAIRYRYRFYSYGDCMLIL